MLAWIDYRYLAAIKDLTGPYRFGANDSLIVPHPFLYGGTVGCSFLSARKTPVHPSLLQVCQSLLSITACCKSHSSFYHAWQALDGHRHTWTFSPFILEQCYIGLCICSTISTGSWVCFSQAHASHFWLNEGWVAYIEQLLQELICTPGHGLS